MSFIPVSTAILALRDPSFPDRNPTNLGTRPLVKPKGRGSQVKACPCPLVQLRDLQSLRGRAEPEELGSELEHRSSLLSSMVGFGTRWDNQEEVVSLCPGIWKTRKCEAGNRNWKQKTEMETQPLCSSNSHSNVVVFHS